MCRSTPARPNSTRHRSAGFTLIEVLVALCIVATLFSSIAALVVTAARGSRTIEERLAKFAAAGAILATLPGRDELLTGTRAGEIGGYRWRIDAAALNVREFDPRPDALWLPETIAVTINAPNGSAIRLETVRLRRRGGG